MREAKIIKRWLNSPRIQRGNFFSRMRTARSHTNRPVKIFFRRASAKPTSCVASYRKLNSGNGSRSFCHKFPAQRRRIGCLLLSHRIPSDPKLAHLDGLNLSRAWMLQGILSVLPADDPRRAALASAAQAHRRAGLAAVTGKHYEGGHWLGSFAVYLTTKRGIEKEGLSASQPQKRTSENTAR